ncbi:hypothetical protein OB920_10070 [Halobacteria archaeon HArc-gm2]|nr:hypothetical protein [Halobacteria archaeon HArc-gm2]
MSAVSRQRVVFTDVVLSLSMIAVGAGMWMDRAGDAWPAVIAAPVLAVLVVPFVAAVDRRRVSKVGMATAVVGFFAAILLVGVAGGPVAAVWGAATVGAGVGMVAYRLYFGVVRPIPPGRLEQARRSG